MHTPNLKKAKACHHLLLTRTSFKLQPATWASTPLHLRTTKFHIVSLSVWSMVLNLSQVTKRASAYLVKRTKVVHTAMHLTVLTCSVTQRLVVNYCTCQLV